MDRRKAWIESRNAPQLLMALLREFTDRASISFEGNLKHLLKLPLEHCSQQETDALKRQTLLPRQDFLVVPVTPLNIELIHSAAINQASLGASGSVIHVQLAHGDRLLFGAYDHFDPECVVAYEGISPEFLDRLRAEGVISSYQLVSVNEHRWHD